MPAVSSDIWDVMSTARAIRRFTDQPVDDATLARCLEAATWAPSGANAQGWRFIVLRSPEQRAVVAQGLGACLTSWSSYGGEQVLREAVGIPDDWLLAGHVVVGWPKGNHGPVRRKPPVSAAVNLDRWDGPATDLVAALQPRSPTA
jgi:nitroreductase